MNESRPLHVSEEHVLSMTPATRGVVHFTGGDHRWSLPMVAWALVVEWIEVEDGEYGTDLYPVVLDEFGHPCDLRAYFGNFIERPSWRVDPSADWSSAHPEMLMAGDSK